MQWLIHQAIESTIQTFELERDYLHEDDPWNGMISTTDFVVRSTLHTFLLHRPGKLVFGRDIIVDIQHTANWKYGKK
jgi:hypothetical protein